MKLRCTFTIFRKEIRDVLRDRRTLMVMIVLPIVLYPVLMIVLSQVALIQARKLEEKPADIVVQGAANSPSLAEKLETIPAVKIVQSPDPTSSLKNGDIQMIVAIPTGFEDSLRTGKPAGLTLYYDKADDYSNAVFRKVAALVDTVEKDVVRKRLEERNIDPAIIHPIAIEEINVAPPAKMGAYIFGGALALILTMIAFMGAFYPAIDLTAGEKERGTLETLLVSPASRMDIVLGKFLTVITISALTGFMNLVSMGATVWFGIHQFAQGMTLDFSISPWTLVLIFLLLLPLAVLFSSVSMAIASFTRSFKEGQNLLTPVQMLAMTLGFVVVIPGIEMTPAIAIIPVSNVVLLIKEILLGEAKLPMVLLVFASIGVAAMIGVRWAVSQFQREDILFAQGEQIKWSSLLRRRHTPAGGTIPGMGMAWLAYLIGLLLLFYLGQVAQTRDLTKGLLLTEIVLIAGPPILIARRLKYDIRTTFRLRSLSPASIIWTILAAASTWVIVVEMSAVQNEIFPYPKSFLDAFKGIFETFHSRGLAYSLGIMALLPAVCEEILFRGFVLTGFRKQWGTTRAVVITAILFGLFHLSPYRYIPTACLGVVIGAAVVWTGSLWAGMLAHFVANGISTVVFHLTQESHSQIMTALDEGDYLPLWLVALSVIMLLVSVRFLLHQYRKSVMIVAGSTGGTAL